MAGRPRKLDPATVARTRAWYRQWKAIPRPAQVKRELGICETTFRQLVNGTIYKESARG